MSSSLKLISKTQSHFSAYVFLKYGIKPCTSLACWVTSSQRSESSRSCDTGTTTTTARQWKTRVTTRVTSQSFDELGSLKQRFKERNLKLQPYHGPIFDLFSGENSQKWQLYYFVKSDNQQEGTRTFGNCFVVYDDSPKQTLFNYLINKLKRIGIDYNYNAEQ